jgi:hypothetical protein
MDAQTLWLMVLTIATPLAGVIGFALQLRQVKQARLENEKLQLEIEALKREAENRSRLVQVATTDEVLLYRSGDGPRYSRGGFRGPCPGPDAAHTQAWTARIRDVLIGLALGLLALTFVAYLVYDIYRSIRWMMGVW